MEDVEVVLRREAARRRLGGESPWAIARDLGRTRQWVAKWAARYDPPNPFHPCEWRATIVAVPTTQACPPSANPDPALPQSEQPKVKWTSSGSGPGPTTLAVEWDDAPDGATERACAFLSDVLIAQATFNHAGQPPGNNTAEPLTTNEAAVAFKRHIRAKYRARNPHVRCRRLSAYRASCSARWNTRRGSRGARGTVRATATRLTIRSHRA